MSASGSWSACLKPCSENPAAAEVLLMSANVNAGLTNPGGRGVPVHIDIGSRWHAVVFDLGDAMAVHVFKATSSTPTHSIALAGTRKAHVRFVDDTLVVGDELGRLVAIHAPTGAVICDLRAHLQ